MSAKPLVFHEAAREKIRHGVDILADAVKVTLGPRGRTVILERDYGTPQIGNSGVVVARTVELEDRFENMGAQLLREVAARTREMAGGGVALLRARRLLHGLKSPTLDEDSGVRIVMRALEEPLRCIVANAGLEASVIVHRIDDSAERGYGYNAATREYGDLLKMGAVDPVKVTRPALQNASAIAGHVLTTDCLIANAPAPRGGAAASEGGAMPAF